MATLNIVRSTPDETVEKFIATFSQAPEDTVVRLYQGDVDWSNLVDQIFAHDKVISWW